MAAVHGKLRDHSNVLRRGIGETLILLSVYGRRLFDERLGGNVESRVSDLVRKLLSPLDMQRLLSFEADLPALAEAAPQAFLEAIEADLRGDEPSVLEVMKPVDSGIFGAGCSRTGILWALECLAWSPELLPRVVEILARLSCRTIDDDWVDTPRNTLLSLFRFWLPETAASVEQRMRTLDGLVERYPAIGWSVSLCMARTPRTSVVGCLMPEILSGTQEAVPFVRWCLDKMSESGAQRYEPCLESFLSRLDPGSLPTLTGEVGRTHGESGRLRLFVSMPYRIAWALLETERDTFREAYWEKVEFDAGTYSAEDVHEMVDGLLKADRPLVALKAVSHIWDAVETSRLTKLLHALAGVTKRFDGSGIPGAFESLDRRFAVPVEEKAKLEFMFFRALRQSRYRVPNLARQMVSSPGLYAEAVIRAFSRRNRGDDPPELRIDDAEQRKDLAMVARDLLQWLCRIPGSDTRDAIDGEKLTAWLDEVRALCMQYGRAEAGDLSIGTLLSHAPHDDDGRWPCRPVCEALERMSCGEVDQGFIIGTNNARGVITRQIGEGGEQERTLAAKYRDWAQQIAYEYPHVGSILERIAEGYDHDSVRQDTDANLQHRFPNW